MELHSYAKRRASKKWTIEQKRKLVEARLNYDSWFNSKPSNSVVPWKKVLSVAKLDDFNVFFVRKQWSNMLTRYKQYKQTHLDGIATNKAIHAEMIQRINQEWEFFEAIHTFMTRKTTNLHSYAVTQKFANTTTQAYGTSDCNEPVAVANDGNMTVVVKQEDCDDFAAQSLSRPTHEQNAIKTSTASKEGTLMKLHDCVKENIPNNTTILLHAAAGTNPTTTESMMPIYSSDTNEEFEVISGAKETGLDMITDSTRNTDHDFYSKRSAVGGGGIRKFFTDDKQLHYFLDTSEESIGTEYVQHTSSVESSLPSVMENIELHTENGRTFDIKMENMSHNSMTIGQDNLSMHEMPSTSMNKNETMPQNPTSTSGLHTATFSYKLTERDKYYRHKRRFNRRLEKRFDAILNVMGQVVKAEYPSVNVKPLLDTVTSMASGVNQLISSGSEDSDDNESGDKDETKPPRSNNE